MTLKFGPSCDPKPLENNPFMIVNKSTPWWSATLALALALTSCETASESPSESAHEAAASSLELAVEQRGEPCTCVAENMEAMLGLLESLKSTPSLSAQSLNAKVAEMVLPCMKPTGDGESDRAYSRAMGECADFMELTSVMNDVKNEVQSRIQKETSRQEDNVLDGAKGANEVLDKLRSGT